MLSNKPNPVGTFNFQNLMGFKLRLIYNCKKKLFLVAKFSKMLHFWVYAVKIGKKTYYYEWKKKFTNFSVGYQKAQNFMLIPNIRLVCCL